LALPGALSPPLGGRENCCSDPACICGDGAFKHVPRDGIEAITPGSRSLSASFIYTTALHQGKCHFVLTIQKNTVSILNQYEMKGKTRSTELIVTGLTFGKL